MCNRISAGNFIPPFIPEFGMYLRVSAYSLSWVTTIGFVVSFGILAASTWCLLAMIKQSGSGTSHTEGVASVLRHTHISARRSTSTEPIPTLWPEVWTWSSKYGSVANQCHETKDFFLKVWMQWRIKLYRLAWVMKLPKVKPYELQDILSNH